MGTNVSLLTDCRCTMHRHVSTPYVDTRPNTRPVAVPDAFAVTPHSQVCLYSPNRMTGVPSRSRHPVSKASCICCDATSHCVYSHPIHQQVSTPYVDTWLAEADAFSMKKLMDACCEEDNTSSFCRVVSSVAECTATAGHCRDHHYGMMLRSQSFDFT